ncbi:MAG: GHKL domain-containing protein [Candidatus Eisenbacteria sp.]|nr:GHKL domain-containing protein [Candidatus Eisenbacteria bacterium]
MTRLEKTGRIRHRGIGPFSGWLLLGLFLILLLLVLNAGLFVTYRQVRGTIEEELGQRLLAIACAAAAGVSPSDFEAVQREAEGEATERLRSLMERIRIETDLGEIYLIDLERRHLLDPDGRWPPGYEHPALELHFGAVTAALAGVATASDLYRVGQVYLETAFAPVLGSRGEVLGAIAVEGGSGFFQGLWNLRRQVLVSGAAGMAAILGLTLFFSRLLRAQAMAARTLRETAALAAAGELAAILAHEIRNPLAIISACAERVQAKIARGKPAEDVLTWFEAIPREVDRLNQVLTQYLSFARPTDLQGEAVALGATIDAALSLLGGDFVRKGITVERGDKDVGHVRLAIAPTALHQILLNLFLNARDAMPEGGRVVITARKAGDQLMIRISDNGCGMNQKQQRHAFERFYTTKSGGSGLGLAVVRSMLDLYGGRVDLESEEGRGTTFTVWIRMADAE